MEYSISIGLLALAVLAGVRAFGQAVATKIEEQAAAVAAIGQGGPAAPGAGGTVVAGSPAAANVAEAPAAVAQPALAANEGSAAAPPIAAAGLQLAVDRTLDEGPVLLAANELVANKDTVPENLAELEKQLKVMAENKGHIKSMTFDEATASIQIRLDRLAKMAGYKDASIPLERDALPRAKPLFEKLKAKIQRGEVPTHDEAKQLYDMIRKNPLPPGARA